MTIQLRQICLVARELKPVIDDLTTILGITTCYVDPGVGKFGLENTLMPVGKNFLEVVAPVEEGTAGGRYLDRRGGDGGYMVITQIDTLDNQRAIRQRALVLGVWISLSKIVTTSWRKPNSGVVMSMTIGWISAARGGTCMNDE